MTEQEQMIEDCQQRESRLSDWERKFIDNIDQRLGVGGESLSEKQADKLESIWDRVTT